MASSHVTQVNDANFESEVLNSDKLVLIDFYADWCGPCKSMAPRVEEFAAENPDVKVVKVNIDQSPGLTASFAIKSIPTLVTMKHGASIYGSVGAVLKSGIEKLVTETRVKLAAGNGGKPPQPPHEPTFDF